MRSIVKLALQAVTLTAFAALAGPALAQDDSVYDEGAVVEVTSVKTKPGKFDDYMKYLSGPYRQQQEALKKAGVILSYSIFATVPRRAGDPDLYLTVTYKNMAAMDDLEAKSAASTREIYGTRQQAAQGMADRESMRTILGSELIRELKLK